MYDVDGSRTEARLDLPWPLASARVENLRGKPMRDLHIGKGVVEVPIAPYQIVTVRLRPSLNGR